MKNLSELFRQLKRDTSEITSNPLLNSFTDSWLDRIDTEANDFIVKEKKDIIGLIENIGIDFNERLKNVYTSYSELILYILIKDKHLDIEKVPEVKNKRMPDFKIQLNDADNNREVYAELKSMFFTEGNLRYKKLINEGLDRIIDLENQIKNNQQLACSFFTVNPLGEPLNSPRYFIETLIKKIRQNIKKEQYDLGDTTLIIDLKQTPVPGFFKSKAVAVSVDRILKFFISGILWHIAFGEIGHLILKANTFPGQENTDGKLEENGILTDYDYIKAIIFLDYSHTNSKDIIPKKIGLYNSSKTSQATIDFLHKFCDFVNDEKNTMAYEVVPALPSK